MATIQESFTKPDRFIRCPACGQGAYRVCHLPAGTPFGPWYCEAVGCGEGFRGSVIDDALVAVELTGVRRIITRVTLAADKPFTLVVDGMRFEGGDREYSADGDRFFYEEHSCPINSLHQACEVYDANGEADPHGVFRYVGTEDSVQEEA